VGYTGRTIHSKQYFEQKELRYRKWLHGRYFHIPASKLKRGEFFVSSLLYNFYRAKKSIKNSRKAILLEGPLDGMKLAEACISNWVANLGTMFCYPQRSLLVEAGVTDLYVAYDNDPAKGPKKKKAGEEGFKRVQKVVGDLFNVHRVSLPLSQDCGSMSVEQILEKFDGIAC
jgi:DNA primase